MPNSTVTLAELITQVRQRSDMEGSTFVSDTEIRNWINTGLAELHDIMVQSFEDYYVESQQFTIVAETPHTLPDDFYKVLGVDFVSGGVTTTVLPYSFAERNMYKSNAAMLAGQAGAVRYIVQGNQMKFLPDSPPAGEIVMYYIPEAQQFANDSTEDTVQLKVKARAVASGYQSYIVASAAIKCLMKEESDVRMLIVEKREAQKRIEQAATGRDAGHPARIVRAAVGVETLV